MPLVLLYCDKELWKGKDSQLLNQFVLKPLRQWIQKSLSTDGVKLDLEEVEIHVHPMSDLDLPGSTKFKVHIFSNAMPERVKRKKKTTERLGKDLKQLLHDQGVDCRVVVSIYYGDSWSSLV